MEVAGTAQSQMGQDKGGKERKVVVVGRQHSHNMLWLVKSNMGHVTHVEIHLPTLPSVL